MTDVYLFQTLDDGDIATTAADIETTAGLETAVYLSLFGGDEDDNGSEATKADQWWGNVGLSDPDQRQTSRTQYLLNHAPPALGSLVPLQRAIVDDLAWLGDEYEVAAVASLPSLNRVSIIITVNAQTFEFLEDWATHDRT